MLTHAFLRRVAGGLVLVSFNSIALAQQPVPPAGGNWKRVEALPVHTKVHITTDHGGHTCRVFAVTDDAFTCDSAKGHVIPRGEIQHIKLAHYGRSTLVGLALGAGIGGVSGAVATRCGGSQFCIVGSGAGAVVLGVGGAAVGAAIGGPTDFTRGSAIYTRP